MSGNSNTQGSGSGAGTGSGSGSGSGAGTGSGNGGSGTGPGRTRAAALAFLLACVVTGLALVIAPLASEYTNPDIRITAYLMAGVVLWAVSTHVVSSGNR